MSKRRNQQVFKAKICKLIWRLLNSVNCLYQIWLYLSLLYHIFGSYFDLCFIVAKFLIDCAIMKNSYRMRRMKEQHRFLRTMIVCFLSSLKPLTSSSWPVLLSSRKKLTIPAWPSLTISRKDKKILRIQRRNLLRNLSISW